MTPYEMEEQLRNLNERTGALEQKLPLVATKDDLSELRQELVATIATLATKEDLKAFATKEELKAFALKDDLKAFATKQDLDLTTEALQREISTALDEAKRHAVILNEATRDEIRAVAEQMATKGELRDVQRGLEGSIAGLRTEFQDSVAGLRGELKGDIADLRGELTTVEAHLRGDMQGLSKQIAALVTPRRRKTR